MRDHPEIPGDPIIIFFHEDGVTRCVTTWAKMTDMPGRTAIRAGISPSASPVSPGFHWYPTNHSVDTMITHIIEQNGDLPTSFWDPYPNLEVD